MTTLVELRHQAGLSQMALAQRAGIRVATLSDLERGKSRPRRATIQVLAQALACSPEQVAAACQPQTPRDAEDPSRSMGSDWPFLQGLDPDLRRGLAQALVVDWTHHSTALEGNTLTAGDTLFVLSEGMTVAGKTLREHQEIYGHADAIGRLAAIIQAARPLTQGDLHQLHRCIQTEVVRDIFQPIGAWKVEGNGTNALCSDGTRLWLDYAHPSVVASCMAVWLEQLENGRREARRFVGRLDHQRAVALYTDAHLGFTAVHPYADGNGRMARLLANLPLLSAGLPPLLVPVAQRRVYLTLMGDYTRARGQPQLGQNLVPALPERQALADFFAACWATTLDLVASYQQRQAERARSV